MLAEIVAALAARGRMAAPPAWQRGWEILSADSDEGVLRLARLVAVRFGDPRVVPPMRALVADAKADAAARRDALAALVAAKDDGLPPMLQKLIADPVIQKDVFAALAAVPSDDTPAAIIAGYQALPAEARQAAIATLVSRPVWTLALLDAIAAGTVPRGDLSAFTVGQLARSNDKQVLAKLQTVWGTVRVTPAERQAEFAAWRTRLDPEPGSPADAAARMRRANPVVIPRNHRVEESLAAAEAGDLTPVRRLVAMIRDPFAETADNAPYGDGPPPGCGPYRTFCGT
jgi:hypothetical protein